MKFHFPPPIYGSVLLLRSSVYSRPAARQEALLPRDEFRTFAIIMGACVFEWPSRCVCVCIAAVAVPAAATAAAAVPAAGADVVNVIGQHFQGKELG